MLAQELGGWWIVLGREVGFALGDLGAAQVIVVQVVWRGAADHAAEHQLVVNLSICAQGVVVVLGNRHVFDLDASSFGLGLDQLRRRVPVGIGVNTPQREGQVFAILLEVAI